MTQNHSPSPSVNYTDRVSVFAHISSLATLILSRPRRRGKPTEKTRLTNVIYILHRRCLLLLLTVLPDRSIGMSYGCSPWSPCLWLWRHIRERRLRYSIVWWRRGIRVPDWRRRDIGIHIRIGVLIGWPVLLLGVRRGCIHSGGVGGACPNGEFTPAGTKKGGGGGGITIVGGPPINRTPMGNPPLYGPIGGMAPGMGNCCCCGAARGILGTFGTISSSLRSGLLFFNFCTVSCFACVISRSKSWSTSQYMGHPPGASVKCSYVTFSEQTKHCLFPQRQVI